MARGTGPAGRTAPTVWAAVPAWVWVKARAAADQAAARVRVAAVPTKGMSTARARAAAVPTKGMSTARRRAAAVPTKGMTTTTTRIRVAAVPSVMPPLCALRRSVRVTKNPADWMNQTAGRNVPLFIKSLIFPLFPD